LRERKEDLERVRQKKSRAREAQREILSEVVSVSLHIRSGFMVPDTNISVDNLEKDLSIRVPTTVVIELEGLAKETGLSLRVLSTWPW